MAKMDEATHKRVRAGRLMLAGKTVAEAAKAVGVARQAAYTWKARLDEGGIDALRSMATGRPAQLDGNRSSLPVGSKQHCGDVMIYVKLDRRQIRMVRVVKTILAPFLSLVFLVVFIALVWPLGSLLRSSADPLRLAKKPRLPTYRR